MKPETYEKKIAELESEIKFLKRKEVVRKQNINLLEACIKYIEKNSDRNLNVELHILKQMVVKDKRLINNDLFLEDLASDFNCELDDIYESIKTLISFNMIELNKSGVDYICTENCYKIFEDVDTYILKPEFIISD